MVNLRDKIVKVKTSKLAEYKRNNKIHPESQINQLADTILKFGFTTPILIDKENTIIAGHGRFLAAEKLQLKEVPCMIIDDLTDSEIKALRIADNRLAELSETDWINVKEEYKDLMTDGSSLEFLTGYSADDLNLFKDDTPKEKNKKEPNSPGKRMGHYAICPKCDHEFKISKDE